METSTKSEVKLIPYMHIDGVPTFKDSEVMALYEQMEADGTVPLVFFDGSITSAARFLRAMKYGGNRLYVVLVDGVRAGIVFLNRFDQRTVHFNWCLFSEFWGRPDKAHIACATRDIVMHQKDASGRYLYDAFLGLLLKENFRALNIAKLGEFTVVGEIPNGLWNHFKRKSETGVLVCYPRQEAENEDL